MTSFPQIGPQVAVVPGVAVLVVKFVMTVPPVLKTPVWFGSINAQVREIVWLVPRRVVEVAVTVTVGAACAEEMPSKANRTTKISFFIAPP